MNFNHKHCSNCKFGKANKNKKYKIVRSRVYSLKTLLKDLKQLNKKISSFQFGAKTIKLTKEQREQEKQKRREERLKIRQQKQEKKERISLAKKLRDLLIQKLGLRAGNESMEQTFYQEMKRLKEYDPTNEYTNTINDIVKRLNLKIDSKTTLWDVSGMCSDIIHS